VVKLLSLGWWIRSVSLKLNYLYRPTFVRLATSFIHTSIKHSIATWNRTVCFITAQVLIQVLNKGKIQPCFKTKSANYPTKSMYIVKKTVTTTRPEVERYPDTVSL